MAKLVSNAEDVIGKKAPRKKRGRPADYAKKDPSMLRLYKYEQLPLDAYFTPEWCVHALLDNYTFENGIVWEPFVGIGRIAKVFEQLDYKVISSDIKDYGYPFTWELDFNRPNVEVFAKEICDRTGPRWIITNPPYHNCKKYVERILGLCEHFNAGAAVLLRNEFDCGTLRAPIFQDNPAYWGKIILTKRPRWFEEERASPRHNYAWYVWDYRNKSKERCKNLLYSYRKPDGDESREE